MNHIQGLVKNISVLIAANIVSLGLGFFYMMYTARYLGAENFGVLNFGLAFTGMFAVFSDFGLSTLATREISRDKTLASKYLGNIVVMKIFMAIITFFVIAITINLMKNYPNQTIKVVYFIGMSIVLNSFTGIFNSIFQAFGKMEYQSIANILLSLFMFGGTLIGIEQGSDVVWFAILSFVTSAIVLGYSFTVCIWKFVLPKLEIDLKFWKQMLKEALPFGLSSIFVLIYFYSDSVMLSVIKGNLEVGIYNAAYRLVYLLLIIPSLYFTAIFPIMSKLYTTSKDSLIIYYERSFKYMLLIIIPIAIGTTLLSDKIIILLYGEEYIQSAGILQILVWAVFFSYLSHTPTFVLNSINKQSLYTKVVFLCMLLNAILNLILIPRYSYIGAGIATVITEFTAFVLLYKCINNFFNNPFSVSTIVKPILCGALMGLYIHYFKNLDFILLIFSSALLYFISLALTSTISRQEYLLLKMILKIDNHN